MNTIIWWLFVNRNWGPSFFSTFGCPCENCYVWLQLLGGMGKEAVVFGWPTVRPAKVRVCVCVRACVCACMHACVRTCVRACVCGQHSYSAWPGWGVHCWRPSHCYVLQQCESVEAASISWPEMGHFNLVDTGQPVYVISSSACQLVLGVVARTVHLTGKK